jgi:hypothetical protein
MLQQFTKPDPPCCDGCEITPRMSTATKGAVSEYLAVVDMLRRGWHVFRSVSPACPWDVIAALPDGRLVKIEIKSAVIDRGKLYGSPLSRRNIGHDVVCYVTSEGVVYEPPIDQWEPAIAP